MQFRADYGELVIVVDNKSWRVAAYEYYKWARKNIREEDDNDWDELWAIIEQIKWETYENLPYPIHGAEGAEADDVFPIYINDNPNEKHMIVSNDKDLVVLTKAHNVEQWRPVMGKPYEIENHEQFEFDMFISGDKADGIPSIKCNDDFLKVQAQNKAMEQPVKRAPAISAKFKAGAWEAHLRDIDHEEATGEQNDNQLMDFLRCSLSKREIENNPKLPENIYKHFVRNRQLIGLGYVPDEVNVAIRENLKHKRRNGLKTMMNFLTSKKMGLLAQRIKDFEPNTTLAPSLF